MDDEPEEIFTPRLIHCKKCSGTGGDETHICEDCGGRGLLDLLDPRVRPRQRMSISAGIGGGVPQSEGAWVTLPDETFYAKIKTPSSRFESATAAEWHKQLVLPPLDFEDEEKLLPLKWWRKL